MIVLVDDGAWDLDNDWDWEFDDFWWEDWTSESEVWETRDLEDSCRS